MSKRATTIHAPKSRNGFSCRRRLPFGTCRRRSHPAPCVTASINRGQVVGESNGGHMQLGRSLPRHPGNAGAPDFGCSPCRGLRPPGSSGQSRDGCTCHLSLRSGLLVATRSPGRALAGLALQSGVRLADSTRSCTRSRKFAHLRKVVCGLPSALRKSPPGVTAVPWLEALAEAARAVDLHCAGSLCRHRANQPCSVMARCTNGSRHRIDRAQASECAVLFARKGRVCGARAG